jgi:very-short-patch-repair endonuclease
MIVNDNSPAACGPSRPTEADAIRTRKIEANGYRVLRFWNHDVLGNLEGVLCAIQNELTPTPTPPRRGEGSASSAL